MIVVISLSLIIPFLMILFAQKRDYETLIEQITIELGDAQKELSELYYSYNKIKSSNWGLESFLDSQKLNIERGRFESDEFLSDYEELKKDLGT